MERQFLELGELAILLINIPLVTLNVSANAFYAYCLRFPPCNRQRLKQPLKMLLEFLVWLSLSYFIILSITYGVLKEQQSFEVGVVLWIILLLYVNSSMTCSAWLSFYYYIQIVPSQWILLIMIKRNIKSVIYMGFVSSEVLILFCSTTNAAAILDSYKHLSYINGTWAKYYNHELFYTGIVSVYVVKLYILGYVCLMMVSNFSTVHYLHRHTRCAIQGGFPNQGIKSQMRVTISGITQGVLYIVYCTFYLTDLFSSMFSPHFSFSARICLTVASLYMSGTMVNMGIGQIMFRQRAAEVWKALKALWGVGTASNDAKVHTSQSPSGEIAAAATVDVQMSV